MRVGRIAGAAIFLVAAAPALAANPKLHRKLPQQRRQTYRHPVGQHVGEDAMRRRARRIQDLMQTVGPLAGVVATAAGSIYTGLKGMLGP
jgi:hypothetical protein